MSRALSLGGLAMAIAGWVQGSGFDVQGSFAIQGSQSESRVANPESRSLRVGFLKPGAGYTVTSMPIESYVARVLAGEAVRDSQPAALEA